MGFVFDQRFLQFSAPVGGITTIVATLKYKESDLLTYCIFIGMGIFWIINVSYQILFPFPVVIMKWILLAFAVTVAGLYWFAVYLSFDRGVVEALSNK